MENYSVPEVRRITKFAREASKNRRRKVTSVDKANVLATSRLWRRTVTEMSKDYGEIELNHFYVDNCAMQLAINPKQFDVIVTGNLFGDILSDEAAVLGGSIGMMPSASIGESTSLYEPIHGSAPDIQSGLGNCQPFGYGFIGSYVITPLFTRRRGGTGYRVGCRTGSERRVENCGFV